MICFSPNFSSFAAMVASASQEVFGLSLSTSWWPSTHLCLQHQWQFFGLEWWLHQYIWPLLDVIEVKYINVDINIELISAKEQIEVWVLSSHEYKGRTWSLSTSEKWDHTELTRGKAICIWTNGAHSQHLAFWFHIACEPEPRYMATWAWPLRLWAPTPAPTIHAQ